MHYWPNIHFTSGKTLDDRILQISNDQIMLMMASIVFPNVGVFGSGQPWHPLLGQGWHDHSTLPLVAAKLISVSCVLLNGGIFALQKNTFRKQHLISI